MALYPSLEDMKVDQHMKAQLGLDKHESLLLSSAYNTNENFIPSAPPLYGATEEELNTKYPSLNEYMGLELTRDVIAANMPEYLDYSKNMQLMRKPDMTIQSINKSDSLIAPVSSQYKGIQKSYVTNGIKKCILCKDRDGKVGLRVQSINNGVFINLVTKNSPAAMGGLRFGDQILEINDKSVAGLSMNEVHDIIKKSPGDSISFVIRDRPFERTVTLHKNSTGQVGFLFKDGKIIKLAVDSSAAKNGLLTEHNLLEVNGQNVIGMKDKEISKIIAESGDVITVTVVPTFIYQHMTKSMSTSLIKNLMDHSVTTF